MSLFLLINSWNTLGSGKQGFFLLGLVSTLLLLVYILFTLFPIGEEASDGTPDARTLRVFIGLTVFGWTGFLLQVLGLHIGESSWLAGGVVLIVFFPLLRKNLKIYSRRGYRQWMTSTGNVSRWIPPHQNGYGKVYLMERGVRRELDAVTVGHELEEGAPIRVVDVIEKDKPLIVVEPLTSSARSQR